MRFFILATILAATATANPLPQESLATDTILAEIPATVVVKNIDAITSKSNALIVPARQLSIVNAPLLLLGSGPWFVRAH